MRSAVWTFDVVAPPISSGRWKPWRVISSATVTISSSEGVIRPLNPMMSALLSLADFRISWNGTMTPRSMTSKLLHCRTTPTMFLPMSCTSPLTVAMTILPLGREVGQQVGDRLFHHPRALDHLRQEHLARAEEIADHVHAGHQRALDDLDRPGDLLARLLGVGDHELVHALDQRMLQPLLDRPAPPLGVLRLGHLAGALVLRRELEQLGRDLVVDLELAGIDDAHVHAGLNGVVQEHRVHRLAHRLVAAEGEGQVADAARDLRARATRLD